MSSGFLLILAVLILGGVIATVGDRLGTRVGKARLSLFNLRPRRTAVLITIMTGSLIAASTFAILFAVSEQLRTGVFELGTIQKRLTRTRRELTTVQSQKQQVEGELSKARTEQAEAQRRLDTTNQSLKTAVARQAQAEAARRQAEAARINTQQQLDRVSRQASSLRKEINQLQSERQLLITQRDQVKAQIVQRDQEITLRNRLLAQRDQEILKKEQDIAQQEERLRELQSQRAFLELALQELGEKLRTGNLALPRSTVLASKVLRVVDPSAARQAVDVLLLEANQKAIQAIQPGVNNREQIIQITTDAVNQLIDRIDDGNEYIVRIIAAANYFRGERTPVQVVANVVRNQLILRAGDTLSTTSINPADVTEPELRDRISELIYRSEYRARQAGLLTNPEVAVPELLKFLEQVKQYRQTLEIRTVAAQDTYTAGPLKVEFVAFLNGQVVFRTQER